MNAQATKEYAKITVESALAMMAKKWAITERQALEQIAKDAISGNQSGLTKSFTTLLAESRKFLESGKAYDTLSIA